MIPSPTPPAQRKLTPTFPERYAGGKLDGPLVGRYGGFGPSECVGVYAQDYEDDYECT